MEINLVFIAAVLILLLCIVIGGARGFLRSSLSLVALFLSWVIVAAVNPVVTGLLREHTKLDEWIEIKVEEMLAEDAGQGNSEEDGTITLGRDVTLPADITLPDGTVLQAGTVIPAGTVLPAGIGFDEFRERASSELSTAQQSKLIEMLPIPKGLRDTLEENNNEAFYQKLGVERFTDYIGSFISNICLSVISYAITFVVIYFVLRIFMLAFKIVDRIPIIHGINHFAGALLGVVKGLLLLEILLLVLIPFTMTAFGKNVLVQINDNSILSMLYHKNFLMKLLMGIIG